MSERVNRRDQIIAAAAELFIEQGYAAASVRQIAEKVDVTEAAIYYHFKDKRDLFGAVLEVNMPDLVGIAEGCTGCESLRELVTCIGVQLAQLGDSYNAQMRWLMTEFPRLTDEERSMFHERQQRYLHVVIGQVNRFVDDATEARKLTWAMFNISLGFGLVNYGLDMQTVADFDSFDMLHIILKLIEAYE